MTHPAFSQVTAERLASFCALVVAALRRGSFWDPKRWSNAVVVMRTNETTVTSRGDFAGFLAGADLHDLARECTKRKVPKGSVLCFVDVEASDVAATGFLVVPVVEALKERARL